LKNDDMPLYNLWSRYGTYLAESSIRYQRESQTRL
jgi:hypothetical protein